jgi:hypothetical protein
MSERTDDRAAPVDPEVMEAKRMAVALGETPAGLTVMTLLDRLSAAERALELADRWVLMEAESQVRRHRGYDIERGDPAVFRPYPEGLLWDHACGECIPGGPMVSATFKCAIHAARARAALGQETR